MSRIKIALMALLVLFLGLGTVWAQSSIKLTISVIGVEPTELFINGKLHSPQSYPYVATVKPGSITVSARAPGYADFSRTLTFNKDSRFVVQLGASTAVAPPAVQNHTLTIQSNVAGAQVFANDRFIGTVDSPIVMAAGSYRIKVTAPGFDEFSSQVNLNSSMALKVTLNSQAYTLQIVPNVANASIFLNNVIQRNNTWTLPGGTYQIRVTAPGYGEYNQTVVLASSQVIQANLTVNQLSLEIQTNVQGALIYLNNQLQKGNIFSLGAGSYQVRVSAPGYQDFLQTVQLSTNQILPVTLVAQNFQLTVSAQLDGAQISINGNYVGNNAVTQLLPPGTYQITVAVPGYQPYQIQHIHNRDSSIVITRDKFVAVAGTIRFNLAKNENPAIYIDGQIQKGRSTDVFSLMQGIHTIKLVFPTGWTSEISLNIVAGKTYNITPVLQLMVSE